MKKKISSLVLVLVLCAGLLTVPAAAAGASVTEVVPCQYDKAEDFHEGLAAVCKDDKWGFIDKTGNVVIPLKYNEAHSFSEGLAAVKADSGKSGYKWGFIDRAGNTVVPFEYDDVGYGFMVNGSWQRGFSEGMAAVWRNNKMGFVDKSGTEVISCKYDNLSNYEASRFSEGFAAVVQNDKWGYIDRVGEVLVPCQYDSAGSFSEGYAYVGTDSGMGYEGFYSPMQKMGFIDKMGQLAIPLKYKHIFDGFSDGLARVDLNGSLNGGQGQWGYINTDGEEIVPCQYDWVNIFSEDLATVRDNNGKWGIIDRNGNEIVPCTLEYQQVGNFEDGLVAVDGGNGFLDQKWGVIDKSGMEIIPCIYDNSDFKSGTPRFSEGLMAVALDNRDEQALWEGAPCSWGFIDRTGQEIVPFKYDCARNFNEGMAAVNLGANYDGDGGKWGFIQKISTAYQSTQTVQVDGKSVEFQCYALKDENGNATNYIKLRDLADILNGSAAQFQVGWDGAVTITTKTAYTPNGSEGNTPFSGDRAYQEATAPTKVNGQTADLAAFVLNDDQGGGYTYYQLRDLAQALGFNVGWSADKGVYVETDKPYDPAN